VGLGLREDGGGDHSSGCRNGGLQRLPFVDLQVNHIYYLLAGAPMSEVVSFKVSREVKEKMRKYRAVVNWSEELRRFVEEKLRELEARETLEEVLRELERATWSAPRGFSAASVREDRDRG